MVGLVLTVCTRIFPFVSPHGLVLVPRILDAVPFMTSVESAVTSMICSEHTTFARRSKCFINSSFSSLLANLGLLGYRAEYDKKLISSIWMQFQLEDCHRSIHFDRCDSVVFVTPISSHEVAGGVFRFECQVPLAGC